MKVYIGSDHRGIALKTKVIEYFDKQHYDVVDVGAHDEKVSCDYPKIAVKVAGPVGKERNSRGVLICMSGIGQSIAANKVNGALAALCYNPEAAKLSRQHNNANVLVLSSKFMKATDLNKILKNFFETDFEGGRHLRRVNQMKRIEKNK